MHLVRLGNSSIEVSRVAFGCMSLQLNDHDNPKLLRNALDKGINYFDTADLYDHGENERLLGRSLADHRKELIIATKVGNEWNREGTRWRWNPTKEYIMKAVDKSLDRLQTDYIDLYQLHGGTIDDPIDETIDAFELLKQKGKIREYGISSIRPNVIREFSSRSNIVSVMMQYSLLDRRPEEECLDLLHETGISVVCRGVLAKGMLLDKPATDYLGYSRREVENIKQQVQATTDPLCTVLAYPLRHPSVASDVIGIRTEDQLNMIIKAYDRLSELASLDLPLPNLYTDHR